MPRLERRSDGREQVGQLILERLRAAAHPHRDEAVRDGAAAYHREEDQQRRCTRDREENAADDRAADRRPDELRRTQRDGAADEQPLDRAPLRAPAESSFGRGEERGEERQPLVSLHAAAFRLADVRRKPLLHPAAAANPREHEQRGEDERADEQ